MKTTIYKFVIVALFLTSGSLQGQSDQSFSAAIVGNWEGSGSLFGQPAEFSMRWSQDLHQNLLSLTFENRFVDNSGTERVMKARAFYHLIQNKGQWYDSRGMMLPLKLELQDEELTVFWGDDKTEKGKTIYSISGETVNVKDFVFRNDIYQPFGEASYKKIKE